MKMESNFIILKIQKFFYEFSGFLLFDSAFLS